MRIHLSESDKLKFVELKSIVEQLELTIPEEVLMANLDIANYNKHSKKIKKLKSLQLISAESTVSLVKEIRPTNILETKVRFGRMSEQITSRNTTSTAMAKVFDSKKEPFTQFLKKLNNAMEIDSIENEGIKLLLLKAKLDRHEEKNRDLTFSEAVEFLKEVYDGDRSRNMAAIKAERYRINTNKIYESLVEYHDLLRASLDGIDKLNKLSFNNVLKTRMLDRYECHKDFCDLAMDISDYWSSVNNKKGKGKKQFNDYTSDSLSNKSFDISRVQCHKCKGYGHYANKCDNKCHDEIKIEEKKDLYPKTKTVSSVDVNHTLEDKSEVNKILVYDNPNPLIILNLQIGQEHVDTLIDSGSTFTLMAMRKFRNLLKNGDIELKHTDVILIGAFGNETIPIEKIVTDVVFKEMKHAIEILIVPDLSYDMILGIKEIKLFNMLNIPNEYFMERVENNYKQNKAESHAITLMVKDVNATSELEVSNEFVLNEVRKSFPQVDKVLSLNSNDIGKFIHKVPKIEWDASIPHSYIPYKYPVHKTEIGQYLLKEMLKADILEIGYVKYLHNIIIVRKHSNENVDDIKNKDTPKEDDLNKMFRIVVDLRSLNKMCKKIEMPGLRIESLIPLSEKSTRFISIDLCQSFHQFELMEEDRLFFGIAYPGMPSLRFKRLPQGFINSPAYMKYLLEREINADLLQLYYDDGIRGTDTNLTGHFQIVEQILRKFGDCNLKINASKSLFCARKLQVLGFEVSEYGAEPGNRARNIMQQYKTPKSADDIRRFLGFISYYRRFLPKLGLLLQPITRLLRKGVDFSWNNECSGNFTVIKELLLNNPRLYTEVKEEPLMINTDASFEGFGGCLYQIINNQFQPLLFCSASRRHNVRIRSAIYLELQGVIEFFRDNRHRIIGKNVIHWFLDNKSAVTILNSGNTDDERFLSWLSELPPNIEYFHISGSKNYVADSLSRDIEHTNTINLNLWEGEYKNIENSKNNLINVIKETKKYRGRPMKKLYKNVISDLKDEESIDEKNLTESQKGYIKELHEKGHFCYQKIYHLLNGKFEESKIKIARKELKKVIKDCKSCLKVNIGRSKKKRITMKVTGPRAVMNLDIAGPFMNQKEISCGKKRYFISLVDYYSKNIFATFTNSLKSVKIFEVIAKTINDKQPIVIKCDNAKYFSQIEFNLKVELVKMLSNEELSNTVKEMNIDVEKLNKKKLLDIILDDEILRNKTFDKLRFKKIVFGSPYHSKSNGNVERSIRTLEESLSKRLIDKIDRKEGKLVTQEDLDIICKQYNKSFHTGIKNTPDVLFSEEGGDCVMEETEITDIVDGEIYVKKKPFLIKKLEERYVTVNAKDGQVTKVDNKIFFVLKKLDLLTM
uniref:RNA-directed DNA polymerase n=1 Tax=Strongyloides papillosus TaxID=174720 RepID=A0A0N5C248_STREA